VVSNVYQTISNMQLVEEHTFHLKKPQEFPQVNAIWKWQPHRMLVANWLCLCYYPIHCQA